MTDRKYSPSAAAASAFLTGHEGPVQVVRFTSEITCTKDHGLLVSHDVRYDGKYCFTGGSDRTIRLWNPFRADPMMDKVSSAVAVHGDDTSSPPVRHALPIQMYAKLHSYGVTSLAVDASSEKLISASGKTMVLSDVVTGKLIRKFFGHEGLINNVACYSDSSMFLSGSYDATVRIWDGRSRSSDPIQLLKDARDSVSTVAFVEEKQIMTASVDGYIRTYDVRQGKIIVDFSGDAVTGVCLSRDGLCVAASCLDGSIHLVEKSSGELLNTYRGQHKAGNYGLECCITSNDAYIASGSEDGRVVLYEIASGDVANVLEGHIKAACSIDAHPGFERANIVVSAGFDGKAILWTHPSEVSNWGFD